MEPSFEGLQASLNNAQRAINVIEAQRNHFASLHVQSETMRMEAGDKIVALEAKIKELQDELDKTKKAHLRVVEPDEPAA